MSPLLTDRGTRTPWSPFAHRQRLALGLLAVAGALGLGCGSKTTPPSAPDLSGANVLLISVDTLRADRLGAYGDQRAATPTIDRLAHEGIRFANCYASVPLTLPSHSSMFTGRYPFALQVRNNGSYTLDSSESTLAEQLQGHGYQTAAFVSSYVLKSKFGLAQGFDRYDDRLEGEGPIQGLASQISADEVVDRFTSWLDAYDKQPGKPFFAWLHFYDPHLPYTPPEPFAQRFADDLYRGEIAFVDDQIARALAAVERKAPGANTLTVVVSDHGEAFGEHGEVGHGILTYEESLRVPLILAGPGLPGVVIEDRARLLDLTPTLLELLGIPEQAEGPGASLLPLLRSPGGRNEEPRDVYFESVLGAEDYNWAPITGLIDGHHKYTSLPQPELYDLNVDPGETRNLFRTNAGLAEELDQKLQQTLLASESGAGPTRELTADDLAHLRALGYLGQADRSASVIDPKQGIRMDNEIKRIRGLVDAGDLTSAAAGAAELEAQYGDHPMPSLYSLRHEIAARQGDSQAAVAILETGLAALPDSPRLLFLLAHYLEKSGRLQEATAACRRLLEVDPVFSEAHTLLGRIAEAQNRFDESVGHYERALASEPLNTPLRLRHAEALLRAGKSQVALQAFNQLAHDRALDDQPWLLYRIAMLNAQAGDTAGAEPLFRQGLETAPGGIHHLTFAMILIENGKADEAARHLTLAIERYPEELSSQQLALANSTRARLRSAAGAP